MWVRKGWNDMSTDVFSKRHPMVNFIFFLGAIGFGVVIQHPTYLQQALGLEQNITCI